MYGQVIHKKCGLQENHENHQIDKADAKGVSGVGLGGEKDRTGADDGISARGASVIDKTCQEAV